MSKLFFAGLILPCLCNAGFVQENVMKPKKYTSACTEEKSSVNDYKNEKLKFFSTIKFECQSLPTAVVCLKDGGKEVLSFNYFETENECAKHLKGLN